MSRCCRRRETAQRLEGHGGRHGVGKMPWRSLAPVGAIGVASKPWSRPRLGHPNLGGPMAQQVPGSGKTVKRSYRTRHRRRLVDGARRRDRAARRDRTQRQWLLERVPVEHRRVCRRVRSWRSRWPAVWCRRGRRMRRSPASSAPDRGLHDEVAARGRRVRPRGGDHVASHREAGDPGRAHQRTRPLAARSGLRRRRGCTRTRRAVSGSSHRRRPTPRVLRRRGIATPRTRMHSCLTERTKRRGDPSMPPVADATPNGDLAGVGAPTEWRRSMSRSSSTPIRYRPL